MASAARAIEEADALDGMSLPGWLYHDAEYHAVEMARVMRPAWQIVCHESDIAEPGQWRALDWIGESAIVIRGADRRVRAFHNVCRHRGSRIVDGAAGCARKLVCPYHAWVYEADGRLSGVPERADYPGLDAAENGLLPIEMERWRGFLFVRLEGGGPSVAAMMAPYEAEIASYALEEVRAAGPVNLRPRAVNWKNVGDNYSDALHIPVGHPGLTRLFGRTYDLETRAHVDRLSGTVTSRPSSNVSERAYQRFLPDAAHLPADKQKLWLYFKFWPNTAIELYPDQIGFMQWLPVSPTQTMLRDASYALPGASREMRAARYLNGRINRLVNAEDHVLIARVQAGMESGAYKPGPLSTNEPALRAFSQRIRRLIPEARLPHPPAPGWSRRPALASA